MIEYRYFNGKRQQRIVAFFSGVVTPWTDVALREGTPAYERMLDQQVVDHMAGVAHMFTPKASPDAEEEAEADARIKRANARFKGMTAAEWFAIAKKRKVAGNWLASRVNALRKELDEARATIANVPEAYEKIIAPIAIERDTLRKVCQSLQLRNDDQARLLDRLRSANEGLRGERDAMRDARDVHHAALHALRVKLDTLAGNT